MGFAALVPPAWWGFAGDGRRDNAGTLDLGGGPGVTWAAGRGGPSSATWSRQLILFVRRDDTRLELIANKARK